MKLIQILIAIVLLIGCTGAYRILAVIPFSGKAHYTSIQPILEELVARGHHVTVISPFEEDNPPSKYDQITVEMTSFWDFIGHEPDIYALESIPFDGILNLGWDAVHFTLQGAFNSTNLQDFIKNDNSHFDLIFAEVFYQEAIYMFAHKYKAPIVGISTLGFTNYIGENQGNPLVLPYMTHEFLNFGKRLSFLERITNLYATAYDLFWRRVYLLPKHQKLAEENFKHLRPLPNLEDLEKNISVILINTHFSYDVVRSYVPGIVEIGGAHIKKPKDLPKDIQQYLDDSKDGAIIFSFGSNVKSKNMPKEKLAVFRNVFKKLKQRVIWKWENASMEKKPDNVMIKEWFPQNEILAHPNIKLFITHGGLLSVQEAIYHGVPVVGFAFYGDQHLNLAKIQDAGVGVSLSFNTLTEESLTSYINDILINPKYRENAKEISSRFKDRPIGPMDTAIYWIEYVIRHKGANFARSPVLDLSWFEYYMIDAFIFIAALILIIVLVILTIFKICLSAFVQTNDRKPSKKND